MKIFKVSIFCLVFLSLSGCDQLASGVDYKDLGITPIEMKHFVEEVKRDLVFVEGGEYLMGDYGLEYGPEQMSYDSDGDSRPVHKVKLSTFSIARFKISNKEFEMYLKSSGLKLRSFEVGGYRKSGRTLILYLICQRIWTGMKPTAIATGWLKCPIFLSHYPLRPSGSTRHAAAGSF